MSAEVGGVRSASSTASTSSVSGLECAGFVTEVADTGAEHICIRSRPGAALLNVARPSLGSPETRPRAS